MHKTLTALSLVTAITASLSAGPLAADTEFEDSIPIDLARSLLRGAGNATAVRIYSDIPDDFPTFNLPDGATLLGSVDQEHSQQVVLLSDSDGLSHQDALIESLQNNGYLLIERTPANMRRTGFISPTPQVPSIPAQLCHDSLGSIYIRIHPETDRTFINITATANTNRGGYTCADQVAQWAGAGGGPAFLSSSRGSLPLQSSMPRLALPDEATTTQPGYMPAFVSASSNHAESQTEFSLDWSLTDVFAFFADQIVGQDWKLDSETAGNRVALGAWTKEDNNRTLLGTLQLVSMGDDNYQAKFEVSILKGDGGV